MKILVGCMIGCVATMALEEFRLHSNAAQISSACQEQLAYIGEVSKKDLRESGDYCVAKLHELGKIYRDSR